MILITLILIMYYIIIVNIIKAIWTGINDKTGIIFNNIKIDDNNPKEIYRYNEWDSSIEKYVYDITYIPFSNIIINFISFIPIYTKSMRYHYYNDYHIAEDDIERLLNKEVSIEDLYRERKQVEDKYDRMENDREDKINEINRQFNELF